MLDPTKRELPSAAKLLRFIDAAKKSGQSPIKHLSEFKRKAAIEAGGPWHTRMHAPGSREAGESRPLNPLGEMVRTYLPHLMGDQLSPVVEPQPQAMGDRGAAKVLEFRLRQWADDAGWSRTDETSVLNALLAIGVQYVYRNVGAQAVADENDTIDVGQPGVSEVPIENMVVDPKTLEWETPAGIGHWIEVDRMSMLERGVGDPDVLMSLPNSYDNLEENRDTIRDRGGKGDPDQYLGDPILLWEFTFTHVGRQFYCCLPSLHGRDKFIVPPQPIENEPEGSRYIFTQLDRIPGFLEPVSPAMAIMDAHLAKAAVASKLVKQIEDLERKYAIAPGMQDAVMRLRERGGDGYVVCDPSKIQEFIRGGMVKELVDGYAFLEQLGRQIGPNVELQGGRDDPGDSATASSILAGNAGIAMGYWRRKVEESRTKVLRRVSAMLLAGADRQTYGMPTPGGVVPMVWDAAAMWDVSYDQYRYRVRPSAPAGGMDARAKLRSLFEILTAVPALLQAIVPLGGDPQKLLRVIADLSTMPELDEMLPSGDAMQIQMLLAQHLAGAGKLAPAGAPAMPGGLAGSGPQSRVGQLNQNISRAVPV